VDGIRRPLDLIRPSDRAGHAAGIAPPIAPIAAVIAARLIPDNGDEPLFPKLKRFGRGVPGVAQEEDEWWVIRDERGRVVGGAMVASIGPDHPVSVDVAVDPRRQAQGFGSALYAALEEAGVDVEAGSAASLAHRTITPLGYVFMRSRRLQKDPDAEANICAAAGVSRLRCAAMTSSPYRCQSEANCKSVRLSHPPILSRPHRKSHRDELVLGNPEPSA
jgi:GNAT superfamily N-acetyltransferase